MPTSVSSSSRTPRAVPSSLPPSAATWSATTPLTPLTILHLPMGTFCCSRHELVFAWRKGEAPHVNSFELGQHGRYRTNVWAYKGVNTRRAGRMEALALRPTVKPVQMIADAIKDVSAKDVSARGEILLDLFAGSGSTLIAADKTGHA